MPSRSAIARAASSASTGSPSCVMTRSPARASRSTLYGAALAERTIVPHRPTSRSASATARPWFPVEEVTTASTKSPSHQAVRSRPSVRLPNDDVAIDDAHADESAAVANRAAGAHELARRALAIVPLARLRALEREVALDAGTTTEVVG